MKIEIQSAPKAATLSKFPCLMLDPSDGDLRLFLDSETSVVLSSGTNTNVEVGEWTDDTEIGSFELFAGSLTLRND